MCFNKLFKFVILIILLVSFAVFSGCGGNPVTPPPIEPEDSEIPELTESITQEIDLFIGGTVEVIDPESIINGVKLIIPPISSEKKGGKSMANMTISYIDNPYSLELPGNRGFLLPPVVINSDILFDAECILEIPYTEATLINMGLSNDKNIKVYRYNYTSSSWEEALINKRNNRAEIDFDYMQEFTITIDDINMTYACSTPSIILPFDPGLPQPGDLLYRLSNVEGIDGWIPGHVGIYVGEKAYDGVIPYNVVEALHKKDGIIVEKVMANYYNPISEFAGEFNTTYMGVRQPRQPEFNVLDSNQRKKVVWYAEEMVGKPYAWYETSHFYCGLARGELVKGLYVKGLYEDSYNCVGLAEAAYEFAGINGGVGLVTEEDEGNNCFVFASGMASPRCVLTPAEQYAKTEPTEGYTVSGRVTDSWGNGIPDVTLNFELVSFNDYHNPFEVTTDSDGKWFSGKLGREWHVTPQKDGYTFEPSTIKVKENANDIDFTGTFITGSQYVIQWSNAESSGWANPLGEGEELITSTAYDYNSDIYLNNWGKKHTGTDIIGELDGNVYSIANGTIVKITRDYSSTSNQSVVIIKHTNSNNENFFAIYGHVLARSDLEVNSELEAGEKIGTIKKAGSPVHLHFGINLSLDINDFIDGVQLGWGLIPESANPSDYDWVDSIDYLNTYLPLSSLTPEEVELIRKWGFGGDDIVRRWPDGYVDVYDETSYTQMQNILNEWNTAIGGTVIFHLSNDPNSPVKVKFDPDISQDLAGQYLIYCSDDDYEFYRADVNIQKNYLDSLNLDTKYCLYLWLFSGVAGFNIQADVDPNPFKEWQNFDKIPDDIKTMLHGLYKVPCGYNLLDKKLKENWSQPTVRNLQNIYEGKLYEYK